MDEGDSRIQYIFLRLDGKSSSQYNITYSILECCFL